MVPGTRTETRDTTFWMLFGLTFDNAFDIHKFFHVLLHLTVGGLQYPTQSTDGTKIIIHDTRPTDTHFLLSFLPFPFFSLVFPESPFPNPLHLSDTPDCSLTIAHPLIMPHFLLIFVFP